MRVRVSWSLAAGDRPRAGEAVCSPDEVASVLRPLSGELGHALGPLRFALTAEMPEGLRTAGRWDWALGGVMVTVERV